MAVSKNNPLTHGASGMIGGTMVFKTWNGKTYISNRPSKPKKQSAVQKENRLKFKMATNYAKLMMKDPVRKEEYKQVAKKMMLPNAYTAAITEYMRKPEIKEVDLSGYTGQENEEINVSARKKGFEIEVVEVIIVDDKGQVVEQGKALKKGTEDWAYKTTRFLKDPSTFQVIVRARERTGNYVDKKIFKQPTE
jgi:hypothetical protein